MQPHRERSELREPVVLRDLLELVVSLETPDLLALLDLL